MSTTIPLQIAEDRYGQVLVIGTRQEAVARRLLGDRAYDAVKPGWFMRIDGRWTFFGEEWDTHGTVPGVRFDGVDPLTGAAHG